MNYLFNGNWVIDWPGTYQVAGTTIVYQRHFDGNETITSAGPTGEDLHIMVGTSEIPLYFLIVIASRTPGRMSQEIQSSIGHLSGHKLVGLNNKFSRKT